MHSLQAIATAVDARSPPRLAGGWWTWRAWCTSAEMKGWSPFISTVQYTATIYKRACGVSGRPVLLPTPRSTHEVGRIRRYALSLTESRRQRDPF